MLINVGLKIKEIVNKNGLTINKLSELSGISRHGIMNLFNGKTSPTVETLQKIADALEVPISYFFSDSNLNPSETNNQKQSEEIQFLKKEIELLKSETDDLHDKVIRMSTSKRNSIMLAEILAPKFDDLINRVVKDKKEIYKSTEYNDFRSLLALLFAMIKEYEEESIDKPKNKKNDI